MVKHGDGGCCQRLLKETGKEEGSREGRIKKGEERVGEDRNP